MVTVVVSPHFDDAVLSCWSVLESDDEVLVVTVFTAPPADATLRTWWDEPSGLPSQARMEQRAEENRAALAIAGRSGTNLGFLEKQYGGPDISENTLADHIRSASRVYVPAGTAIRRSQVNREHVLVRDAVLRHRRDAHLYADQPYNYFRAGLQLPAKLRGRFFPAEEVLLDSEQRRRKASAIAEYAGELQRLEVDIFPGLRLTDPETLERETFWSPLE